MIGKLKVLLVNKPFSLSKYNRTNPLGGGSTNRRRIMADNGNRKQKQRVLNGFTPVDVPTPLNERLGLT